MVDSETERRKNTTVPSRLYIPYNCLQLQTYTPWPWILLRPRAPAEMPRILRRKEYPDFMERLDKPMYTSHGVESLESSTQPPSTQSLTIPSFFWLHEMAEACYDAELQVQFTETALPNFSILCVHTQTRQTSVSYTTLFVW
ncbi:hypothetical protein SAY86_009858 [Trapa natans]|uniref:Uncharacterized protein n=1 Tax=Trapa natans TaxID=22666 RepID=A0AAN7L2G1_TRANT|nr:hypothetical protein SAY86_009858 [Trapa natans]